MFLVLTPNFYFYISANLISIWGNNSKLFYLPPHPLHPTYKHTPKLWKYTQNIMKQSLLEWKTWRQMIGLRHLWHFTTITVVHVADVRASVDLRSVCALTADRGSYNKPGHENSPGMFTSKLSISLRLQYSNSDHPNCDLAESIMFYLSQIFAHVCWKKNKVKRNTFKVLMKEPSVLLKLVTQAGKRPHVF